jgi:HEAT repeat protein
VFFGNFNLYAGIIALFLQLLFTSRYLRRFGVGAALVILPTVVLVGSFGVLILGSLSAIVALKGMDQVLRYSIDKSTAELLYLPVVSRVKMQVKWFIDTVIWRLGDGFAGVTVLICATYLHISPRNLSVVAIFLIGGWYLAVYVARQQYVVTLRESIREHRLDPAEASAAVLDRSATDVLAGKLSAPDPQEIVYALSLFEVERSRVTHPAIRSLLEHPAAAVRQKALTLLAASGDKTVLPQVERLLKDPDLNVRTEALLYLTHHGNVDPLNVLDELGDFEDFSVRSGVVAYLARPGEAQNVEAARTILETMVAEPGAEWQRMRLEAARLLGILPDVFDPLLSTLLSDPDVAVKVEAIRSAGKLRKRRVIPDLLDALGDDRVAAEAAAALQNFGDSVVGTLGDHLGDSSVPMRARREIPRILLGIGTEAAERALVENLLERDTTLRFPIISALNKLHHLNPEMETDRQMLETVMAAEILGHYRSYQILHVLGTAAEGDDPAARGLQESMRQELERIFRLLALLFPHMDVHSVYLGLQSKSASIYDNALELLESALKSQLRNLLVPLLDGRVSVAERVELANRLVRNKIETQEQAVSALVSSDDPWLKACGAYAIGTLGLKSLETELSDCLQHADPLLRETARAAKLRLKSTPHASGSTLATD